MTPEVMLQHLRQNLFIQNMSYQLTFTCSKSTIESLEKGLIPVQS